MKKKVPNRFFECPVYSATNNFNHHNQHIMKQVKQLLLILPMLLFGLGALQAQDSTLVDGVVANLGGSSLTINITLTPLGLSAITTTATCDAKGYFSKMINHNSTTVSTGDVEVSFTDCNSKTVSEQVSFTPNNGGWVGFKLDYCNNPSIACEARFTIDQMRTNTGSPVAGSLVIYENSAGPALSFFHWDFGDGTTSNQRTPSHSYSGNGPYQICLIVGDSIGCRDTLCDSIQVDTAGLFIRKKAGFSMIVINGDAPTSIGSVSTELTASLYPNPAKNAATITYTVAEAAPVQVAIYSMSGVRVLETSTSANSGENSLQLNLQELTPGVYTVKVSTAQGQWIESLIKN